MSTSIALTRVLDGTGTPPRLAGGKGGALDELIARGFAVPPTGIITTDAYHRFVAEPGLAAFLDRLRSGDIDPDADTVDHAFVQAPMAPDLRREVIALASLIRGDGLLAIRSSATAEDLTGASFAGQYRSVLEVVGDGEIERAVRLVWASLWHPAPRAYRAFAGSSDDDLAMAVVVMRLVDADRAGVTFTVDPAGTPGALRIEAVHGLAEQLVAGSVTPDAYVVDRRAVRRQGLDPVIDEVARVALDVERSFGRPMDVEWAHDGDRLFLVQARPITVDVESTGDEFDTPVAADATYTTAGVAEMLPGVLPPLVWTTAAPLLEEGFRQLFDSMAALPERAGTMPFLARVQGRATLSLDLLRSIATSLPGGSVRELERQYFGREISAPDAADTAPQRARRGPLKGLRSAAQGAREIRARHHFRFESDATIGAVRGVLDHRHDISRLDDAALIAYRRRLLDLAARAMSAEVSVAAAAAAAYRAVELFLEPHLGTADAQRAAQRLTAGGVRPCGSQLTFNVCLLTALALVEPEVAELLVGGDDPTEVRALLRRSEAGADLLAEFERVMERAGSAAVFAGETWAESEPLAWQLLRQSIQVERVGARQGLDASERRARIDEVRALFASSVKYKVQRIMTGQIVDVRSRLLRRLVYDAVDFLDRRETTKSAVLALGGEVRRVHLELGARLAERDVLERAEDVDLLDAVELAPALAGSGPTPWALRARRARLERHRAADGPPQVFTGDPSISAIDAVVNDGDVFEGWAASGGRHEARARVIRSASEPLQPGEILVARTTDPSWTPLFLTAGAIVVEEGGPLSHAAIIARELGLPAVLNVPGITDRVGDDTQLVVDGDRGVVTIVVPIADRAGEMVDAA